ncbi:31026_t:CDS:1, partial [Racocetra persica]
STVNNTQFTQIKNAIPSVLTTSDNLIEIVYDDDIKSATSNLKSACSTLSSIRVEKDSSLSIIYENVVKTAYINCSKVFRLAKEVVQETKNFMDKYNAIDSVDEFKISMKEDASRQRKFVEYTLQLHIEIKADFMKEHKQ